MQAKLSGKIGTVAYLSAIEHESLGFYGALLILSINARPVEFHCTHPVRPKPAQRVLFGATLNRYLLGDQIPAALFEKSKTKPDVLFVNQPELIAIRQLQEIPMAIIQATNSPLNHVGFDETPENLESRHLGFHEGETEFGIHRRFPQDEEVVREAMKIISRNVGMDEPFERLTIAMDETCKSLSTSSMHSKLASNSSPSGKSANSHDCDFRAA